MQKRVPYARLRAAEREAARTNPDADKVKAVWTPSGPTSDVCVEVWKDGRANVMPV